MLTSSVRLPFDIKPNRDIPFIQSPCPQAVQELGNEYRSDFRFVDDNNARRRDPLTPSEARKSGAVFNSPASGYVVYSFVHAVGRVSGSSVCGLRGGRELGCSRYKERPTPVCFVSGFPLHSLGATQTIC